MALFELPKSPRSAPLRSHDGSMRQRVIRVAVVAVALALVLFALPLAITIRSEYFAQAHDQLERAALRVDLPSASGRAELPLAETDNLVGVYDLNLRLLAGRGPAVADRVTSTAAHGTFADGQIGGDLVVAVPILSAEDVVGVARASVAISVVWRRVILAWLVLAALAVASLVVAILFARRQAGLIAEPLEALSATSQRVADGDLMARAELSAIPEIHRVAATHNAMVSRLTDMIEKERHFSDNASHQLRTPLTGLQLGLEAAMANPEADLRSVLADATRRVRDLHGTVDDVLALARLSPDQRLLAEPRAVGQLVGEVGSRWHGELAADGRSLVVDIAPEIDSMHVLGSLVTQILNVLMDNAVGHGRGSVTMTVREIGETLAVDVADEGSIAMESASMFERGMSGGDGQGIGLALARSMAEASGGRLVLTSRSPTTITLFIPGEAILAGRPIELTPS
jgi:signal transduction histidine kinase